MATINSTPRPVGPTKTFGEKYETAVRGNTLNNNSGNLNGPRATGETLNGAGQINSTPRNNTGNQNISGSQPAPRPNPYNQSSPVVVPRTSTDGPSVNPKPRMNNEPGSFSPSPRTTSEPNVIPPKPRTTNPSTPSSQPTYNQPRQPRNEGTPNVVPPKPRTYTNPTTPPTYSKPNNNGQSRPSNSYSQPSGNSYNRGGSAPSGGGGGGSGSRRPR